VLVSRSKYNTVRDALLLLQFRYNNLLKNWNDLVEKINQKGGEAFLKSQPQSLVKNPFTRDELMQLIALVHPDKHGGSKAAEELTKKLLDLRQSAK
jgi:hypothetical protein